MTRLLTLAALVAGIGLIASTSAAGDWHHGGQGVHHGHHGHHGVHRYAHGVGGYAVSPNSSYGHGGYYQGQSYGYGNSYGYQPRFWQGYTPRYRSSYSRHRGGLHIDIGRFHVIGIGGHH